MHDDDIIIAAYKEAFGKYAKDGVIDMDNRLKHRFDFQILRLEKVVRELGGVVPPTRYSQYFVTLIKAADGQKTIGNYTFPLQKNTLLCIPKRVMHSSQYGSARRSGYVLCFNLDFFLQKAFPRKMIMNKKIFKSSVRPYLKLSASQVKKLEPVFKYILEESKDGFNSKNEMIAVKILELLIQCDRFYADLSSEGKEIIFHETLDRFNDLLEKHFVEEKSVQFYAKELHIHPNYLNLLSNNQYGHSAKKTISLHVLTQAKYLLTSTSLSISEIAYKLGFDPPEYFYTFFSNFLKISPARYRAEFV
ncbi:MAG TPA: AraC family transcriptional regulator [Puia sp.]|jgi:AraC family transcriptional activator of pobA|nr:AraC family transcriptional regulator [Puia sp.]